MIDAKELKIGNLVMIDKRHLKVESICINPVEVYVEGIDYDYALHIEPIPLTEEWLQNSNLHNRQLFASSGRPDYEYSIRNDYEIYCYLDHAGNCLFYGEISTEVQEFFIIKCNSLHTFQNIFAVLNPSETLTIKDNV